MNSSKGERPDGTDGSDHQARHVVENRYKVAAEARATLLGYLNLFTMYLVTSTFYALVWPAIFGGETPGKFGWALAGVLCLNIIFGRAALNNRKDDTVLKKFIMSCGILIGAPAGCVFLLFLQPPVNYLYLAMLSAAMYLLFSCIFATQAILNNSVQTAVKKAQ